MVTLKVEGMDRVIRMLRRESDASQSVFVKAVDKTLDDAADFIFSRASATIRNVAFDEGTLYKSGSIIREWLHKLVGWSAPHAKWNEWGTSPHFPPIEPIRAWCKRKGIPEEAAFLIARKISRDGLQPRPFFRPAIAEAGARFEAMLRDNVTKIARR